MTSAYDSTDAIDYYFQANTFLKSLIDRYSEEYGFGTMSPSIYDTAWVSMVMKVIDGKSQWLFPNSFQFICNSQSSDGGWYGDLCVADTIVNTLACLLSLKRHQSMTFLSEESADNIAHRVDIAIGFLNRKFKDLDGISSERLDFELIVPTLLEILEKDHGITFNYHERDILLTFNQRKLAKIDFSVLYNKQLACCHSLESFIGKVDFDRLTHLKYKGNFMCSPSSTAAYLMNASEWDNEAEQYLQHVIDQCKAYGDGAVCTVWPTTVFEFSRVICNLSESGFKLEKLDQQYYDQIKDLLKRILTAEDGIIGMAPKVQPDADNTAKTLVALDFLGDRFSLEPLLKNFELETHFRCYQHERDSSFTVNCNVLIALLHAPVLEQYVSQIEKTVTFICNTWWTNEGLLTDNWHQSPLYPMMLASQGLTLLLHHQDGNQLFPLLSDDLMKNKIPITLFQILVRILQSQSIETGSWGKNGSCEETAYAILALANLASLQFVQLIRTQIDMAVARGRNYLLSTSSISVKQVELKDFVWNGKISYATEAIYTSYVLSALHISIPFYSFNNKIESFLPSLPLEKINKFTKFFKQLHMFNSLEDWQLKAYVIESYLFLPMLLKVRFDIFDRKGLKKDHYFEYLPFSWIAPNNMEQTYASAQTIFSMMVTLMVNFQMDEFFDIVVQKYDIHALQGVRICINEIFDSLDNDTNNHYDEEILDRISKFVKFNLKYPRIQMASKNDKDQLRQELKFYVLAQIQQCEDNLRLQAQKSIVTFQSPTSSFFRWVYSTGADHFGTQYGFAFMACLLTSSYGDGFDFLPSAEIKYIAQNCIRHIAVISRISNDYGSLQRDREEKNLNTTFFSEFEADRGKLDAQLKQELTRISQYERKCLQVSFSELHRVTTEQLGNVKGKRLYEISDSSIVSTRSL